MNKRIIIKIKKSLKHVMQMILKNEYIFFFSYRKKKLLQIFREDD